MTNLSWRNLRGSTDNQPQLGRMLPRIIPLLVLLLSTFATSVAAELDATTIKADYDATLTSLDMNCSTNFPPGNAVDATTLTQCEIVIRRLEIWRRDYLVPFERALSRFGDTAEKFRQETERLNLSRQLDATQYDERIHQQYPQLVELVQRRGELFKKYQLWKTKMQAAHEEWSTRQTELSRRRISQFASQ